MLRLRSGSELLCLRASLLLCRSPPEGCIGALLDVGIAGAPKHLCDCACSVCQGTDLLQEFTAFLMYSEKKQLCSSSHGKNKTKARTKCCSQELLAAIPAGCLHLAQTGDVSLHLLLPPPCLHRLCLRNLLPRCRGKKGLPALQCLFLPSLQSH